MKHDDTEANPESGATDVNRRSVLQGIAGTGAIASLERAEAARSDRGGGNPSRGSFKLLEATVPDVHRAMQRGQVTALELVERYLARIETYDESLAAILNKNPAARGRAKQLDRVRSQSGMVGPLHGIPVIVKDNYDTGDIPTTAGSESLAGSKPGNDAFLVERIREAGGIVLAKSNLHEFAYGYTTVSSLGGQTYNPYDLKRVPGGSSGGSAAAMAANLGMVATGSDTGGSVRVPPSVTNTVGVRPTRGLTSRDGIIPLSDTQDVGGPMTRSVTDAAIMLDVFAAGYHAADPVTSRAAGNTPDKSYTSFLNVDGLQDARIGVVRDLFADATSDIKTVVDDAVEDIRDAGATVVDPVPDPTVPQPEGSISGVIHFEFKRDLNYYLEHRDHPPVESLSEVIASGDYSQDIAPLLAYDETVVTETLDEDPLYQAYLAHRDEQLESILVVMADHNLDAMLFPTLSEPPRIAQPPSASREDNQSGVNAFLSPRSGCPEVSVPGGFTDGLGLPVGLELLGRPFDEPRLLEIAYAYEQATNHRRPPARFGPRRGR